MFVYAGKYVQEGNKLTVTRDAAWREDWVGTKITATLEFNGSTLTLTSTPFKNMADKEVVAIVTLERLE
jgi:hypothetical protein